MKKTTLLLLTYLGLILILAGKSNADLVWTFTDDGNGNIRETISGTLDLSDGIDALATGAGGGFDLFTGEDFDLVQVHRYTTPTSGRSWLVALDGYDSNPNFPLIIESASVEPGWQNTDHLLFQIFNNFNLFRAVDFVGTYSTGPTEINEDVVHNVPISVINEGVWRYGNLDDDIEGNGVLFRVGNSVPEPTSAGLLSLGLVGLCVRRRR